MPLKHLEHAGNEDFKTVLNRTVVKKKIRDLKELNDKQKEKRKAKAQLKYMSSENPDLWNGEI